MDVILSKTFYVENLGCFRNQVDAEYIIASMEGAGYTAVDEPSGAQAIVVNTCGFIESAKQESLDTFFELRQGYPEAKIILAGCLAQRYGDELLEMLPEADGIFGNKAPELLPQIMDKVEQGERVSFFPQELTTSPRRRNLLSQAGTAFLKVAEGCIHKCTFCAIPNIRGHLVSRTIPEVLQEFDELRDRGIFEFNLIAQDLASYGREADKNGFLVPLLEQMLARPGNFWIRPFYIHPDTFPEGLLELMKADSRLLPYFDLPFQHADQKVLTLMGRHGNKEKYLDLVSSIREALPDSVLRSTFLVGFPGESRKDFEELLDFQAKAKLDWVGVFTYSREEGTASFRLQDEKAYEAGKKEAHKRKTILEHRQQKITEAQLERWVKKDLEVFIEEPMEGTNLYLGRAWMQAPEVDGLIVLHGKNEQALVPGQVVKARIVGVRGVDLEASQID